MMAEVLDEVGAAAAGHRSLVVLRVDDLDAYCEEITLRGATVLHGPAPMTDRMRVAHLKDPEGNWWSCRSGCCCALVGRRPSATDAPCASAGSGRMRPTAPPPSVAGCPPWGYSRRIGVGPRGRRVAVAATFAVVAVGGAVACEPGVASAPRPSRTPPTRP